MKIVGEKVTVAASGFWVELYWLISYNLFCS
jgi:hypothetical protein